MGKKNPLSNIDAQTAADELDTRLLVQYLVGRTLALEVMLKDLAALLPTETRTAWEQTISNRDALALEDMQELLRTNPLDVQSYVSKAGFACTLLECKA